MLVKDIMRKEFHCLYVPGSRDSVLELIKNHNLKLIPVLEKATRKLLGAVTYQELIKNPDEEDLAMLMNREPITIQMDVPIIEAIEKIIENNCRILVVLDNNQVVGLLTVHLIVKNILTKKKFKAPIKPFVRVGITAIWDETPIQVALYIIQIAKIVIIPCIDNSGTLSGVLGYDQLMQESEVIEEEHSSSLSATEDYDWSWETADTLMITKKHLQLSNKLIKDVMIKKAQIQSVNELTPIKECAKKMRNHSLDQLPCLDVNDKFSGMIYDIDLLKVLLTSDK
ncbi:MAG: CBS domain-containing protein [Promethearchaeota archaeon]|nr:MAG: CBS domain-containing protein [Candidatus Lokiarchaeota archaeon]